MYIYILIIILLIYLTFGKKTKKKFSKKDWISHKRGQKIMTDMLREFDRICRNNNLNYWCVGGTLIGSIRHKGWIPHDADIDVAMLEYDYKKLQKIIQKNLPKDYWFQDKSTDKYYKSTIGKIRYLHAYYSDDDKHKWHNGIQLDIFVFKDDGKILSPHPETIDSDIKPISKNMIFPTKELYFNDILVRVPNNYKKYCKDAWGNFPPNELPIDQQYPHEGRISFVIPKWMKKKYPNLYHI